MSAVTPSTSDFEGAIFGNYRKGVAKSHWSQEVKFTTGSTLPDWKQDLAFAIAGQACHAEHLGMCTAAKLVLEAPTAQLRYAFAAAVQDEATHSEMLGRYATSRGAALEEPNEHHTGMICPLLSDDLTYLERTALHCFLEGFALDQFRTFIVAFRNDLLGDIYAHIRQDEARHVALGMLALRHSLTRKDSSDRIDLARVEETSRKLGNVSDHLFDWLSTIEGTSKTSVRQRYQRNHAERIQAVKRLIEGEDQ
jgi:hypothetical protein